MLDEALTLTASYVGEKPWVAILGLGVYRLSDVKSVTLLFRGVPGEPHFAGVVSIEIGDRKFTVDMAGISEHDTLTEAIRGCIDMDPKEPAK